MKKKLIIVILFVLSVVTVYSVQQSYAKYKSDLDISDNARVAKWDINSTVDVDLFKSSYTKDGEIYAKSLGCREENGKEICDKVIGPGMSGEYRWTLSGTPETNFLMRVETENVHDTVERLKWKVDGRNARSLEQVITLIENIYNQDKIYPATYKVDYDYKGKKQIEHVISWEWPDIEGKTQIDIDRNNTLDTNLGKKAINNLNDIDYASQASIGFKIKIVVEQTTKDANVPIPN